MDVVDATYIVKAHVIADVPLFLWGSQGIGKSSIVKQLTHELTDEALKTDDKRPYHFIDLRLATQEVADLIGMPHKDVKENKTRWMKPEWFPEPGTRGILFLDEMNRAQRDVIQCAFQLVLDRQLHTHKLPHGWRVIAAGNYFGAFDVRELDEAMMGRFGHLDLETSYHAVCNYGIEQGWASKVVDFLRANPTFLKEEDDDSKNTSQIQKYQAIPDPRRWESVSKLWKRGVEAFPHNDRRGHLIRLMMTGMVGPAAAQAFIQYEEKLPSFEDIVTEKVPMTVITSIKSDTKKEKVFQKLCMEVIPFLKITQYSTTIMKNIVAVFHVTPRTDLLAGVLQRISELDNESKLDARWSEGILSDEKLLKRFDFIRKNIPDTFDESTNK